jgi:ABC-type polysaccharide/polyol phosphate transport system ATPase subunit
MSQPPIFAFENLALQQGGGWLFEDINLFIGARDRLALIGRNGAGKTTLLRVLSGVTEPVEGSIAVQGHVTTLMTADSFMDPDQTGYENIWFAGTLLGMTIPQIRSMIPEIEEFVDLGDYMQMPLRTYSTGMKVRLGFAIATAIHPDILILDEAIGAGDVHFAQKARRRAIRLYERAKVIVVASHNEQILRDLCTRGIVLDQGRIVADDTVDRCLEIYAKMG